MKKVCNKLKCLKLFTLLALVCHTVIQADGQQATPVDKGYAPVNGIKMYYEIYGNGEPIVLLHGAFYNIQLN